MTYLEIKSSISEAESGTTLSAEEFRKTVSERAEELQTKLGITPGDCALLLKANSISFFVDLLALISLQATAIPFDPGSTDREVSAIVAHANVNLILSSTKEERLHHIITPELKSIALVLYTSGTTGSPKGVKISANALAEKLKTLNEVIPFEEMNRTLCALPTFFGHGLICNSLFPIFYADHFVIAKSFNLNLVSELSQIIQKHQICFMSTVPSVWNLILNFSSTLEHSTLKRVFCASSHMTPELSGKIKTFLPENARFFNIFGITEMLGWFAKHEVLANDPAPSAFNSFWETERKLSPEGELLVKSSFLFEGYLNNEKETADAFTEDGFFKTGDLFEQDEYKGRLKLVINRNGVKIYPAEIESLLMASGLVQECHARGIFNEAQNEQALILVVLKSGTNLNDVKKYCLENLSPLKRPDRFIEVPAIEKNQRGKISLEYVLKVLKEHQ